MGVFAVLYLGILATLSTFGLFSLSLAGIAGIVLTIGMAADSSILTMERFREEIRMGRSVRAASITGVRHAIVTSVDADLVTLVSALSLFFLASGFRQGLRPDAGAGHRVRHRHDAAVQGAAHPPVGAEGHRKASWFLGRRGRRGGCQGLRGAGACRGHEHGRGRGGRGPEPRRERACGREARGRRRRGRRGGGAQAARALHQARHQFPGVPPHRSSRWRPCSCARPSPSWA